MTPEQATQNRRRVTATWITEELDGWTEVDEGGVPPPIREHHYVNGRYVVDGVPYTKPQVLAFLAGLERSFEWLQKLAEYIDEHHGGTGALSAQVARRR